MGLSVSSYSKLKKIAEPEHLLCKEDIIWFLGYMKKKVEEQDTLVSTLSPSRIMYHFRNFSEVAMLLIHNHFQTIQEDHSLKNWFLEVIKDFHEN